MASSAEVAAVRVVFGTPKDERAEELMRRWLNSECRDWRFESDEEPSGRRVIAVSLVLAMPKRLQHSRQIISMHIGRWGVWRKSHAPDMLVPMTIDQYMDGRTGELIRGRVRRLLEKPINRHLKQVKLNEVMKSERFQKLRQKHKERSTAQQRLVLECFWDNASWKLHCKLNPPGSATDNAADPLPRRRRLSKLVKFDEKDRYTEEGELI